MRITKSNKQSGAISIAVIMVPVIILLVVLLISLLFILSRRRMQARTQQPPVPVTQTSTAAVTTPSSTTSTTDVNIPEPLVIRQRVLIIQNGFEPRNLGVTAGTSVVWTNSTDTAVDIKADTNIFPQHTLKKGESFSYVFNSKGVFTISIPQAPNKVQHITVSIP